MYVFLNYFYRKDKNNVYTPNENLYQRLYDDNKKMKNKYEENLKQLMNDIKDRANHPIVKHNNINYIKKMKRDYAENYRNNIKNMSFDKQNKRKIPIPYYQTEERKEEDGKMYEFKRIEELYEEYKRIKNQIILKENINNFNDDNNRDNILIENNNENINNNDNNNLEDNILIDNNKENNINKNINNKDINNNENKKESNNNEKQIKDDSNNIEYKENKED